MEETITANFIDSIYDFSRQEFPADVLQEAKNCLLDYIGCTMIGASVLRNETASYLNKMAIDRGRCTVIGTNRKADVLTAAFLNGFHSHYIELDDGHRFGMIHIGSVVISAILPFVQDNGLSGDDLLRGIVTGYEATIRLSSAIQPGHKKKGFHATGTCACIGAAIGAAAAIGYEKALYNPVICAAATSAAGLLEMSDGGSKLKPYTIGHAAMAAINAVCFANEALDGPKDILGGDRGFFKACAENVDLNRLLKPCETGYAIKTIYRKPYAACRHAHGAVEAALRICEDNDIDLNDIQEVLIEIYDLALKGHDHTEILNTDSAKMSIPYGVASAICFGKVNYEQFSDACINDERIKKVLKKIMIIENKELSALVPDKRASIVTIKTAEASYTCRADYPYGEPENPLSREALEEKYYSLMASSGKDRELSKELLNWIYNIEKDLNVFLIKL
ncbi:MAG: MmgE/PrpD family protein [Erysipelotrichaceae bacterium]|nr:MmgE/PrpD family protein [Erysipelotrichaceae bacterium]